jgi:hypothetical protein
VPEEGGEGELKRFGASVAGAQQDAGSPEVTVDPTAPVEPTVEPPPEAGDGASRGARNCPCGSDGWLLYFSVGEAF